MFYPTGTDSDALWSKLSTQEMSAKEVGPINKPLGQKNVCVTILKRQLRNSNIYCGFLCKIGGLRFNFGIKAGLINAGFGPKLTHERTQDALSSPYPVLHKLH